jgi:hypothetical protein
VVLGGNGAFGSGKQGDRLETHGDTRLGSAGSAGHYASEGTEEIRLPLKPLKSLILRVISLT